MDTTAFFVALAVIPLVFLISWFIQKQSQRNKLPPGPFPLPFIGNILLFKEENMQKTVYEISRKYGDVITIWFSSRPVIMVNSIEAAKDYLIKQGKTFAGRPQTKGTKIYCPKPGGIFISDYTNIWKINRKVSHSYFNPNGINIEEITEVINTEAKMLIKNIENQNGKPFYPKSMFLLAKMNVVFQQMFGIRNDLDSADFQMIETALQVVTNAGRKSITRYLLRLLPFYKDKYFNAAASLKNISDYFDKQFSIQETTYNSDVKRHWADAMIQRERETDKEFRYQWIPCAIDIMIAGVDSSHNTMLWATVYLALYPEIQERLSEDIKKAVVENEQVTYAKKAQLPYLLAFINETLRHSCVTSFGLPHKTLGKSTLNGYEMEPGMLVMTNVYALHNDERYWKNPRQFNPERFINDNNEFYLPNESLLPFSIGMRACVGEHLAKMDLFGLLGNMIKEFVFTFSKNLPLPDRDEGRRDISWTPAYFEVVAVKRQ